MRYLKFNLRHKQLNEQAVKVVCDYKASYWQDLQPITTDNGDCILKPYGVQVFPFLYTYENKNGREYAGYYSIDGETFYISHTKSGLSNLKNLNIYNF